MAKKEVLEMEVKSNIKQVAKDQKSWNKELKETKENIEDVNEEGKEVVAEMQILGISINGLKAAWTAAASGAKFLFRTVKAGLISTGVGAFVVVLGSIATWFTETKRGAEVFENIMTSLGAAFSVIIDRVAKFGGGLFKIFSGEVKAGLRDITSSFKNIGKEILTDTILTAGLVKMQQKLRDSQRNLNVEIAKQRAEIERLKLIAEDTTKSTKERLEAAKDAFNIENKLLNDRIVNAKEDLRLQQQSMKLSEINGKNTADELDKEAELKIALFNITGESLTKQIELNNKINSIEKEGEAKRLEILQSRKDADNERMGDLTMMPRLTGKANNEIIKSDNAVLDNYIKIVKNRKEFTKKFAQDQIAAYSHLAGALSSLAGEHKQLAVAQAIIDTYGAANAALKEGAESGLGFINAAAIIATGLANVRTIMSTPLPGGGGGGSVPTATAQGPAPQTMGGSFELTGGVKPEPVQAYVVSDDITNNQDKLATIRRRATI